jgi:hypothetical protein
VKCQNHWNEDEMQDDDEKGVFKSSGGSSNSSNYSQDKT